MRAKSSGAKPLALRTNGVKERKNARLHRPISGRKLKISAVPGVGLRRAQNCAMNATRSSSAVSLLKGGAFYIIDDEDCSGEGGRPGAIRPFRIEVNMLAKTSHSF